VAQSTGPILATGLITIVNQSVFNNKPVDWRVPIATGFLAIGASLVEKAAPELVVILAWTTLLTSLLTRIDPSTPAPVETAVTWWNKSKG
jgi:hypothetical protein